MVELVRAAAEAGGRDRFSCNFGTWSLLIELGQVFGWKGRGTTYVRRSSAAAATSMRRDYQPGDSLDYKTVDREDAADWAAALDRAKHSPHFSSLLAARLTPTVLDEQAAPEPSHRTHTPFAAVLDEFIEYAYGGEFSFALAAGQQGIA